MSLELTEFVSPTSLFTTLYASLYMGSESNHPTQNEFTLSLGDLSNFISLLYLIQNFLVRPRPQLLLNVP